MPHSTTNRIALFATSESPCSYIANKLSTNIFVDPEYQLNPAVYQYLTELGFRRSGNQIYRPDCKNCKQCIATRIEVENFKLKPRFKRILNKNQDLSFTKVDSIDTEEHYALYQRYINKRHSDGAMYPTSVEQYRNFLQCDWLKSEYYEWRLGDELVSLAVTDQLDNALSAIFTFFSPECPQRSLGTLGVLTQIEQTIIQKKSFLYLGYWIENSTTMHYKIQYQPLQGLIDAKWLLLSNKTNLTKE